MARASATSSTTPRQFREPIYRYLTPIVSGPIDDTVGAGPSVNLSITSATGYADNGFYMVLGTLGNLTNGYTITGSGSGFGTNLYFNTNPTGNDFFEWGGPQYTVYTTVPGNTSYILGPSSSGGGDSYGHRLLGLHQPARHDLHSGIGDSHICHSGRSPSWGLHRYRPEHARCRVGR